MLDLHKVKISLPKGGRHMIIKRLGLCTVLVVGLVITMAQAESYTGSISYGDGLEGAEVWNTATLSWTVDDTSNPGLWTYRYSFVVDAKAISHVITGVTEIFIPNGIKEGTELSCVNWAPSDRK